MTTTHVESELLPLPFFAVNVSGKTDWWALVRKFSNKEIGEEAALALLEKIRDGGDVGLSEIVSAMMKKGAAPEAVRGFTEVLDILLRDVVVTFPQCVAELTAGLRERRAQMQRGLQTSRALYAARRVGRTRRVRRRQAA